MTMLPVFFPFTYMPPGSAAALQICFDRLRVLQPVPGRLPGEMARLSASGWLDPRPPGGVDAARLEKTVSEIRAWAESNRGSRGLDTAFLQALRDRIFLYDETAPSRIREAIRGQGRRPPDDERRSSLTADLVFLSLAEAFDIQNHAIGEEMRALKRMEADLFDGLRGGGNGIAWPAAPPAGSEADAAADYMLAERLSAWRRAMAAAFAADGMPTVAVTTSRSVVDSLADGAELAHMGPIARSDPDAAVAAAWRKDLTVYLQQLIGASDPSSLSAPGPPPGMSADTGFHLRLYGAGLGLGQLLEAARGGPLPLEGAVRTVVALVEG